MYPRKFFYEEAFFFSFYLFVKGQINRKIVEGRCTGQRRKEKKMPVSSETAYLPIWGHRTVNSSIALFMQNTGPSETQSVQANVTPVCPENQGLQPQLTRASRSSAGAQWPINLGLIIQRMSTVHEVSDFQCCVQNTPLPSVAQRSASLEHLSFQQCFWHMHAQDPDSLSLMPFLEMLLLPGIPWRCSWKVLLSPHSPHFQPTTGDQAALSVLHSSLRIQPPRQSHSGEAAPATDSRAAVPRASVSSPPIAGAWRLLPLTKKHISSHCRCHASSCKHWCFLSN